MLLARGLGRTREIGMRLALGAGRWRVVRQLITENLLLALLGCATGSVAGYAGAHLLLRSMAGVPPGAHLVVDWRMVTASLSTILIAMLGFGLAPAFQAVRPRPASIRTRQALVAFQMAASAVLLILAALLARGEARLQRLELAFDVDRTIAVDPQLNARALPPAAQWAILRDMTARLEALRGVDGVAMVVPLPAVTGLPLAGLRVSPSYFSTVGLPIVRGRAFLERELGAVMVSESGARTLWPDSDALGQTWTDRQSGARLLVVGIVKDSGLSFRHDGGGEAYIPIGGERIERVVLLAHTAGDARALLRDARAAAAPVGLTPTATPMATTLKLPEPGGASVIGWLGSLATLLAVTGLFGLVAFAVAQRTREIGVRVALGASPSRVLATVLRQYAVPIGVGSLGGIALAAAGSQAMRGQLYGLPPFDLVSYAAGIAVLGLAAVAAMLLPAWRALRINAASALRAE